MLSHLRETKPVAILLKLFAISEFRTHNGMEITVMR